MALGATPRLYVLRLMGTNMRHPVREFHQTVADGGSDINWYRNNKVNKVDSLMFLVFGAVLWFRLVVYYHYQLWTWTMHLVFVRTSDSHEHVYFNQVGRHQVKDGMAMVNSLRMENPSQDDIVTTRMITFFAILLNLHLPLASSGRVHPKQYPYFLMSAIKTCFILFIAVFDQWWVQKNNLQWMAQPPNLNSTDHQGGKHSQPKNTLKFCYGMIDPPKKSYAMHELTYITIILIQHVGDFSIYIFLYIIYIYIHGASWKYETQKKIQDLSRSERPPYMKRNWESPAFVPRTGLKPCRLVLLDGRVRLQPSQGFKAIWPPLDNFELQVGDDQTNPTSWPTLPQSNNSTLKIDLPKTKVVPTIHFSGPQKNRKKIWWLANWYIILTR